MCRKQLGSWQAMSFDNIHKLLRVSTTHPTASLHRAQIFRMRLIVKRIGFNPPCLRTSDKILFVRSLTSNHSNMTRDQIITLLVVSAPDLLIAWLVMLSNDGKQATFCWTLGALFGVQLFFTLKSTIAASLVFRLYGKRRLTEIAGQFLRANNFPRPQVGEDTDDYLERISHSDEFPINLRLIAASEHAKLQQLEQQAILPVLRVRSAYDTALHKHNGQQPRGI